ncbi:MAG: NERD domain-containing protein [Ruminococcaceae bacterium]|nr:NERD domain-containing protein [Oscillospiraceae bacterium]
MPFLIAIIVLLSIALAFLKTPQGKGWIGEFQVKLIIGKTKPELQYVINNLVLEIDEGKTSQIDHVVINRSGVFVIETKNYSGRIYGQENHLEWTQVLNYGKVKNKLYNPIKQNKTHIYHISNILTENIPITSAVVFIQGNTQYINASGVYTLWQLKSLLNNSAEVLTVEQMEKAFQELSEANNQKISTLQHIQNIHAMKSNIENNICPRCGKSLILRNGKKGSFYGCSGYPNCKFTKKA